jgi:putative transposase
MRRRPRPATRQLSFARHGGWGGKRKGAGRKPKGDRAQVTHRSRPALASRFPVHVTLRVMPRVWNLRSRRGFGVVRKALAGGGERFGMRICEFSIQGNHMHFVAEASDARALSRGMQGLSVRLAKGLNGMMKTRGKVLADRFHARILRSPTEVKHALAYVHDNRHIHRARWGEKVNRERADEFSSASREHGVQLPAPHSYLLSRACAERERRRPG